MEFRGGERKHERAIMWPHKTQNVNLYDLWDCLTLGDFVPLYKTLFFFFLFLIGALKSFRVVYFVVTCSHMYMIKQYNMQGIIPSVFTFPLLLPPADPFPLLFWSPFTFHEVIPPFLSFYLSSFHKGEEPYDS